MFFGGISQKILRFEIHFVLSQKYFGFVDTIRVFKFVKHPLPPCVFTKLLLKFEIINSKLAELQ